MPLLVFMASTCNVALIPGPGDLINFFLSYTLILAEAKKAEYVRPATPPPMADILKVNCGVQAP